MNVHLSRDEVQTLIESVEHSKRRVREARGTPYEVRQRNLNQLDTAAAKLRAIKIDRQV
jgi:hypothetical protein